MLSYRVSYIQDANYLTFCLKYGLFQREREIKVACVNYLHLFLSLQTMKMSLFINYEFNFTLLIAEKYNVPFLSS